MTNLTGPAFLAGSIPQIVPFSVRETPTIMSNVEAMRVWIRDQLVPFVNESVTQLSENWDTEKTELIEGWESLTTQLIERVDAAVAGIGEQVDEATAAKTAAEAARDLAEMYASTVEVLQDQAVTALLSDSDSTSYAAIQTLISTIYDASIGLINTAIDDLSGSVSEINDSLNGRLSAENLGASFRGRNNKTVTVNSAQADITQVLKDALATAGLNFARIEILPGSYTVSETIDIDLSKGGVFAPYKGVTITTAENFTGDVVFNITRSVDNMRSPANNVLDDIFLVGPGEQSNVAGVRVASANQQMSNFTFSGLFIRNFQRGIEFGSNAYTINFAFGGIFNCDVAIYTIPGSVNMGERLTFIGSTIYNSNTGVINNISDCRIHFVSCSLDYLRKQVVAENKGLIELVSCHVECVIYNADALPWFEWSNGAVHWYGGSLSGSNRDGSTNRYLFKNKVPTSTPSKSIMRDVQVTGSYSGRGWTDPDSISPVYISNSMAGNGLQIYETRNNILANGGFESLSLKQDLIVFSGLRESVSESSGVYEDSKVRLEVSSDMAKSGSNSLKVTKKVTGDDPLNIAVPVQAGKIYFIQAFAGRMSLLTNDVFVDFYSAKIVNGAITKTEQYGTQRKVNTASVNAGEWQVLRNFGNPTLVPAWATHVVLRVRSNNTNTFYLDDITVSSV